MKRLCYLCETAQNPDNFTPDPNTPDGLSRVCVQCETKLAWLERQRKADLRRSHNAKYYARRKMKELLK